jgi:pectate lyase
MAKFVKKIVLTANQVRARKAVETRKANKVAVVAAAEAEALRLANMTGGQKASATKRANGTHLIAAAKAAETKRLKKEQGLMDQSSRPARPSIAPVAAPVAAPVDLTTLERLLALAPMLKAAGLI